MKTIKSIVFFLIILSSLYSCEKIEKDKFSYAGDVTGVVSNQLTGNAISGAEVKFDRGDVVFTETIDENGKYYFKDIPYGTYDLTYYKDSYNPKFYPGYQLYFSDTLVDLGNYFTIYITSPNNGRDISISRLTPRSVTSIDNVELYLWKSSNYEYYISLDAFYQSSDYENMHFQVFLSTDENVSYTDYYSKEIFEDNPNSSNSTIEATDIVDYAYLQGKTKVYYTIYSCMNKSIYAQPLWIDPKTKQLLNAEINTELSYKGSFNINDFR